MKSAGFQCFHYRKLSSTVCRPLEGPHPISQDGGANLTGFQKFFVRIKTGGGDFSPSPIFICDQDSFPFSFRFSKAASTWAINCSLFGIRIIYITYKSWAIKIFVVTVLSRNVLA